MENDNNFLEIAIAGGLIGAALESILSGAGKNSGIGMVAGVVIAASMKANENAVKTNIPLIREENNVLYEFFPDGTKRMIRQIPKSKVNIPKKFTLK